MNKKSFFTYCFLILATVQIQAQVFHSLQENSKLLFNSESESKMSNPILDTINLPFFEDFSEDGMYPNPNRWADDHVYINRSFAYNPPSIGVATFDIIASDGKIYPTAGTTSFLADQLTSLPIDLSLYDASDSLYLSFYYQPQGLGWDMPDPSDSLILRFKNNSGQWKNIWNTQGAPLQDFKQVMIAITDTQFLYKGFQFAFANYASLGDPQQQEDAIKNDFWNIDFVVLDTNRTATDTSYQDVCFYESRTSLFYKYRAVPYKHFKLSLLQKDTMDYHIRNLDKALNAVDNMRFELRQNSNPVDYFVLGTINVLAGGVQDKSFSYQQMENSPGNPSSSLPINLADSAVFEVTQYFDAHATAKPYFSANDTLKFQMNCFNYYAFDDGSAELGLSLIENDTKLAFKIEGFKADTLRGVSALFNHYKDFGTAPESVFNLCVWNEQNGLPGDLIYKEENIKVKYAWGIDHFPYFELQTPIFVDETFFVGFETTNGKLYSIAYDINNHYDGQTYFWKNNWSEITIGTPMIRPHLGDEFMYISVPQIASTLKHWLVYPNPARDYIHISNNQGDKFNYYSAVQVYNLQGELINERLTDGSTIKLSTQNWQDGLYLIKIKQQDQIAIKKVMVQK